MNFMPFNSMHAPPSYKNLGIAKPKKEISEVNKDRTCYDHTRLPLKYITCRICGKGEGTLIRSKDKFGNKLETYEHDTCNRNLV